MIVLDASAVIATLDDQDAHHRAALAIMRKASLADQALLMHPVTLAEALVGVVDTEREAATMAALEAREIVIEPFARADAAAVAHIGASTGLRMPDACVLSIAVETRGELATFDVRLAREARRLGIDVLGVDATP
ncbi:MAG: type II toxin-antitoxin system VapC family toxin [Nocardioides sp.]